MIDHAARKIHFAGAVQSLIIVSNGALSVIKGDRTSIGGQVALEDKLFTLHTVPIQGQMQCYLTSDGIASQLGGSLVRRFGSKQLHSKLLEIEQLPSATRKAEIEKSIDVWMGTEKQTDDILMVGFRPDLIS